MAGRTDEYGNSVPHGTTGTGVYDTTGTTGHATGGYGIDTGAPVTKQVLRRSGSSSSSSSSEDDGMGGRRKKGLKEKIKQKLPGGHKTDEYGGGHPAHYGHFTTTTTHTEPEKKGFGEKIKKKLPGGHKTDEYGGGPPAGYGHPTTTTIHTKPEEKGFEEMISETEKKDFEEMFEEMILETEKKGFEEMILEMAEMIKEVTPGSHN